jgi:hypothetical protein
LEIAAFQVGVAKIRSLHIGADQVGAPKLKALKGGSGDTHSSKRNSVRIQFLKSFDPSAASAFALRGVDHLPDLIVLLLLPVTGLGVVEDDGKQNREDPQVLQNLQKCPSAEEISNPVKGQLDSMPRNGPSMADRLLVFRPRGRTLARFT